MSFLTRGQVITRLLACGLKETQAAQITDVVLKWAANSGEEWTVKRIKSLKIDFLRHLCDLDPISPWVARNQDGSPKGPFHVLWSFSRKELFKVWNCLMIYSGFRTHRMTMSQYQKFITSVNRVPAEASRVNYSVSLIRHLPNGLVPRPVLPGYDTPSLLSFFPSPAKRAPTSYYGHRSVPEEEAVVDSLLIPAAYKAFTEKYWPIIRGTTVGLESFYSGTIERLTWRSMWDDSDVSTGHLSFIHEPGYKLRYVANPYRVWQMALRPFGKSLFSWLKHFPQDCTYDQEKGVSFAKEALRKGKTVYSFDLSGATDNFPLDIQLEVFKHFGFDDLWIEFFRDLSKGQWNVRESEIPDGRDPRGHSTIRWTVGQPLGLFPSFASFALSHNLLIMGLCHRYKVPTTEYTVLGDDVMIFDHRVATAYRRLMNSLGIPISSEKTLVSDKAAEFAGRVILKDGFVLRGYKWKGQNDNSFIDVARNLGPRSMRLFLPRQRVVLKIISSIPDPFGFGWNPEGLPWMTRMDKWLDALVLTSSNVRNRTFMNRAKHVNRLLYNSNWRFSSTGGVHPSFTSDQDVISMLGDWFEPDLLNLDNLLLPNLWFLLGSDTDVESLEGSSAPRLRALEVLSTLGELEKVHEVTQLILWERRIARVLGSA